MNLYLNVIFKTLLLNNLLKQKHDQLKVSNKPAYVPLQIEERFLLTFDRPEIYALRNYNFPKTHFNDIDVINKLNTMLETKIKTTFAGMGGGGKFLNEFMNDVNNLKNIKNNNTIKKKIGKIKIKDRRDLENKINAKIKKYIKNYLKKKEKQLEILEMKIINAKKKLHTPSLEFNKTENKNKIKRNLNSKINKKVNKFKINNTNTNGNNKKNTSRKKYE